MELLAIDHIAITARDLQASHDFYDRLFGARLHHEHAPAGRVLVRQIALGPVVLSLHQEGNGLTQLVPRRVTPGSADFCLRAAGRHEDWAAHLTARGATLIGPPAPRRTALGEPAASLYFNDPDGNLVEVMCVG
jgi:catechol 2,3-dioxygenase-like lactoylglutathione lyase family enzyme